MTISPDTRVRPGPAHLNPGGVRTGQPVTVRALQEDGRETEFPAVYVRTDGRYLCCAREGETRTGYYLPRRVFPRHVLFRRWVVTLEHKGTGEPLRVGVPARTELEARVGALVKIRRAHGAQESWSYRLHSVEREG